MLKVYYNFFDKCCDVDKFEELEMHADYLFLSIAHENICDCIKPDKKEGWEVLREKDFDDSFRAQFFFLEHAAPSIRSTMNESHDCFQKKSDIPKLFVSV